MSDRRGRPTVKLPLPGQGSTEMQGERNWVSHNYHAILLGCTSICRREKWTEKHPKGIPQHTHTHTQLTVALTI